MPDSIPMVGKLAPNFDLPCTAGSGSSARRVALADFRDRWLVLVFYPRDFSLVCPTELTALGSRIDEFRRHGCDLLGVSTDSIETHERWIATPRSQGGLGEILFPLASDSDGAAARAYGVYLERQHVALRGLFIIDPNGVLQYQAVHNLSVGRRSEDVLRILAALETGGMCVEDWSPTRATLDPTQALVAGSMISHYRVEEALGAGSFAVVYRAHDTVLDRPVALKVFKPGRLPSPEAALAEARAAAALNHPNVCTIFAVDDSEGAPVIAMEFVAGLPLSRVIDDGPLAPQRVAHVGRQIASGMAAAHQLGIVHRDLKPANILIAADDLAKITDFGLSRRDDTSDLESTRSFHEHEPLVGTPRYMSPEQTRREVATAASDVFALGLVIFEMLAGDRAFPGRTAPEVFELIRAVEPAQFAARVPPPFDQIIRRALEPSAHDRSITMQEIAETLAE